MKRKKIKIMVGGKYPTSVPTYETRDSAGCDLRNQDGEVNLLPGERVMIRTGISIQLPEGYEAQVRGRSGLNRNFGIVVPVGTIDADYRGEIGVVVYNLSREDYTIKPYERVAQLVISPVIQADWQVVESLDETARGKGGFGSTGK